jgi:hypothetical protein
VIVNCEKAFAAAIERRIGGECGQDHFSERIGFHVRDHEAALRRLATDARAKNLRQKFGVSPERTRFFLDGLLETVFLSFECDRLRKKIEDDRQRLRELNASRDALRGFCNREIEIVRADQDPAFDTDQKIAQRCADLEYVTEVLDWVYAQAKRSIAPDLDGDLLEFIEPKSRKRNPVYWIRVHYPRWLVMHMRARFHRPMHQEVADALNVFFDLPESEELTAEDVRNASRAKNGKAVMGLYIATAEAVDSHAAIAPECTARHNAAAAKAGPRDDSGACHVQKSKARSRSSAR